LNQDSDRDGLSDYEEVYDHGTDPNDNDTDGGGTSDGAEVVTGTDPLDPTDDHPELDEMVEGGGYLDGDYSGGKTGCACTTADDAAPSGLWAGLLAGLAVLGIRRRDQS
jgi:MYXO-CTERM domain-containing protein